jgi:predicted cobalt transporter CbtA
MVRSLLIRGLIAGLLAGAVAFGIAKIIGEPQVDKAIAFESLMSARSEDQEAAADHGHEEELVTRSQQNFAGLGTGALIYGVAIGGIFALVFAIAYGRLGTFTARGTAAVLGLLGYVSFYVVPALKYPATPPAIGNPDTIDRRTGLFLAMILLSVIAMVLAVVIRRRLAPKLGEWNSTLVVGAGYVLVAIVCYLALPGINEVPQQALRGVVGAVGDTGVTFPAAVLWRFRVSAFAIQAGLWATLAIAFGYLAARPLEANAVPEPQPAAVS